MANLNVTIYNGTSAYCSGADSVKMKLNKQDVLSFVNQQVVGSANLDVRSKMIMGRYRQRDPVSPHMLLCVCSTNCLQFSLFGV